jgi:hypothetical protein
MRRLLTILLLAAFGLPVVAPALALGQDPDAHLPACCRRHGAHHCAMNMGHPTNGPTASERCHAFPQPATTAPAGTLAALIATAPSATTHTFLLAATQRAETQRRLSRERSRHKRGPPQLSL